MNVEKRQQLATEALEAKYQLKLGWPQLAEAIGRSPVYTAMLIYGYGQASKEEAEKLGAMLKLPSELAMEMTRVPTRVPAQPWPPTDPFIYRLYEAVMLYGPVYKDVAHEIFGDGIMSAIDMSVDIVKVEEPAGVPRLEMTFNGKWLQYKKY